jgi:hypothetical protein
VGDGGPWGAESLVGLKTTDNLRALRQPILYAQEMWRRQRLWSLFLLVVGVGASVATLVYPPFRSNPGSSSFNWIFFAYIPAGLLLGGGLLFYRWRSRVEVTDEGLKIGNLFSEVFIEYELVRTVRVQPLDRHFQDTRKRLIRPISRPLMPRPALFLRLKGDEGRLAFIKKKLGTQLYADETIALPVPDPDALSWEITGRLPERAGVNLGGRRRRKRTR